MIPDSEQELIAQYLKKVSKNTPPKARGGKGAGKKGKVGRQRGLQKACRIKPAFCYKHSKAVFGLWASPFRVDRSR